MSEIPNRPPKRIGRRVLLREIRARRGVFAFAIKRRWALSNPVAHVDRPKKAHSPRRRIRFLQTKELEKLIGAVPDDPIGAVERPLYLAVALTGLRQGELLALKWMDVDWLAGRVRVMRPEPLRDLATTYDRTGEHLDWQQQQQRQQSAARKWPGLA